MNIQISIKEQTLTLFDEDKQLKQYSISTARNGPGELMDSECTPCGKHIIAEKIGEGAAVNSVFVGRETTGEIYDPALRKLHPKRDWILTRILWLSGTEEGKNKGQKEGNNVDSYDRYIYIHGSPDDVDMGQPGSRGCVRMRNDEMIELFKIVEVGTEVVINL
ncbi:MAG: L,D-transpeptidase [Proteobacteria bacterium]|nr:L,D-transpeptidase [Pseudomonadota bacterium]NOG60155.1 L,D-transpeptidase [Pseudomonadota bacterium]